jgi:hypothetical protein
MNPRSSTIFAHSISDDGPSQIQALPGQLRHEDFLPLCAALIRLALLHEPLSRGQLGGYGLVILAESALKEGAIKGRFRAVSP